MSGSDLHHWTVKEEGMGRTLGGAKGFIARGGEKKSFAPGAVIFFLVSVLLYFDKVLIF